MNSALKNAIDNTQDALSTGVDNAQHALAAKADDMAARTQRAAAQADASLQDALIQVRKAVPAQLNRAAHQVEDLARAGIDKARAAGSAVSSKAQQLGASTTDYVREKPGQSLLIAAAAGAATTLLVGWALRRRDTSQPRY